MWQSWDRLRVLWTGLMAISVSIMFVHTQPAKDNEVYTGCGFDSVPGQPQVLKFCNAYGHCIKSHCGPDHVFSKIHCGCVQALHQHQTLKPSASEIRGQLDAAGVASIDTIIGAPGNMGTSLIGGANSLTKTVSPSVDTGSSTTTRGPITSTPGYDIVWSSTTTTATFETTTVGPTSTVTAEIPSQTTPLTTSKISTTTAAKASTVTAKMQSQTTTTAIPKMSPTAAEASTSTTTAEVSSQTTPSTTPTKMSTTAAKLHMSTTTAKIPLQTTPSAKPVNTPSQATPSTTPMKMSTTTAKLHMSTTTANIPPQTTPTTTPMNTPSTTAFTSRTSDGGQRTTMTSSSPVTSTTLPPVTSSPPSSSSSTAAATTTTTTQQVTPSSALPIKPTNRVKLVTRSTVAMTKRPTTTPVTSPSAAALPLTTTTKSAADEPPIWLQDDLPCGAEVNITGMAQNRALRGAGAFGAVYIGNRGVVSKSGHAHFGGHGFLWVPFYEGNRFTSGLTLHLEIKDDAKHQIQQGLVSNCGTGVAPSFSITLIPKTKQVKFTAVVMTMGTPYPFEENLEVTLPYTPGIIKTIELQCDGRRLIGRVNDQLAHSQTPTTENYELSPRHSPLYIGKGCRYHRRDIVDNFYGDIMDMTVYRCIRPEIRTS